MDTTLSLLTSLCSRDGPTPLSSAVGEYLQAQTLTFSTLKLDAFRSSPLMLQP